MSELLEPVSELGIAKPELYVRILGSQVFENIIITDNIVLGED